MPIDQTIPKLLLPLPVFISLGFLDTVGVLFTTLPRPPAPPSPFWLLINTVNSILIGGLLVLETGFLVWLRKRWQAWRAANSADPFRGDATQPGFPP